MVPLTAIAAPSRGQSMWLNTVATVVSTHISSALDCRAGSFSFAATPVTEAACQEPVQPSNALQGLPDMTPLKVKVRRQPDTKPACRLAGDRPGAAKQLDPESAHTTPTVHLYSSTVTSTSRQKQAVHACISAQ